MTDLLVVVPTRGRRALMDRFLAAYAGTVQGDTDLLVVTDDDDQDAYAGLELPPRASVTVLPRMWLTPKLNTVCVPAAERYKAVGFLADDCVPQSPGWDAALTRALSAPGIAYPEGRRRSDIPEHPFISSAIITALGWFFEPALRHYYADNILADIGHQARCLRHVQEAAVAHLHYQAPGSGAVRDRIYAETEKLGAADYAAYQDWRSNRMAADVTKVRAVTGTRRRQPRPGWQPPASTPTREDAGMTGEKFVATTGFVTDLGDGKLFGVSEGDEFPPGHQVLRAGLHFFEHVPGEPEPAPAPANPEPPVPPVKAAVKTPAKIASPAEDAADGE